MSQSIKSRSAPVPPLEVKDDMNHIMSNQEICEIPGVNELWSLNTWKQRTYTTFTSPLNHHYVYFVIFDLCFVSFESNTISLTKVVWSSDSVKIQKDLKLTFCATEQKKKMVGFKNSQCIFCQTTCELWMRSKKKK